MRCVDAERACLKPLGKGVDWSWLAEKLGHGDDALPQVKDFIRAGGNPTLLLSATFGNREANVNPCPQSLAYLLESLADPNAVDSQLGSPTIHLAVWQGNVEIVRLLLDHRADLESPEPSESGKSASPLLNTALAAGSVRVAVMLLERRASVTWKHEDGATALHVVSAWCTDDSVRSRRRKPPIGDEPVKLLSLLYHNGIDPLQREGMRGLTPFEAFSAGWRQSPWLQDEEIGDKFRQTLEKLYSMMRVVDDAMKEKAVGNKAFAENRYTVALEAWARGRVQLEKEGISGHHVAVFWSNEAMCRRKMGDIEGCRVAASEGLKLFCLTPLQAKLKFNLEARAPDIETSTAVSAEEAAKSDAKPHKAKTQLKGGFFDSVVNGNKPFYSEKGSEQGKSMSELVDVPQGRGTVKVPFRKVIPVECPRPDQINEEQDSE